jgi:hypothetical protein
MECDDGSVDEQFHIFQSMAVPSPAGKTPLRWSDPKDEGTITFQNASNYLPNDTEYHTHLNLWHHHNENAKYPII